MHPLKALGPDGLPTMFFPKYWKVFGKDITKLVLEILNESRDPTPLNITFIALILKVKNPNSPRYFKLISLCNVAIKLVIKVVENRLKVVLPYAIDEEKSAFIGGILIMANAFISLECFNWMKKKKKGKKGVMDLKLDMSKAYDCIE